MIQKIQNAILDMMSKVSYEDKGHKYIDNSTGLSLQGVSTVSSIVPKDWLAAWGAKESVKFLGYSDYEGDTERASDMLKQIKNIEDPNDFIKLLKEAKGASSRKSKDALVDGTAGHAWLETYVLAKIRGTKLPDLPEGNLRRPIEQFLEWEKENIDKWILSEARVAYPARGYAGTLDALAYLKNGKLAIIDYKFASHISEDYYLQTAGYGATFEPYDIKIDERVIIRLPKTLEREEYDQITHKYKKVPNEIEVLFVPTNYEMDKETFFHCLALKKWINIVTK